MTPKLGRVQGEEMKTIGKIMHEFFLQDPPPGVLKLTK
jgi:hypothetical protein